MRSNWVEGSPGGGRKDIAGYYAAITAIDEQVGRLLKVIQELGMEENTIVVFTSDHGNMLGSQGAILKRKPWEESICVPGIIRYPHKVSAGRKSDALFSHVDLGPTLLSLCQIPIPGNIQGADLSDIVLGKEEAGPDSAYFQIFGPYYGDGTPDAWRGVRTGRHMYARSESGPWLLYDLEKDLYEVMNLVTDPSASSNRKELDERLTEWINRVANSWELDWAEPVEDGGRLYSYRTLYTVEEYRRWAKLNPNLDPNTWPSQ